MRQSASTLAAASALYGFAGATALAAGPTNHGRTIAALVDVIGADPVLDRSEEDCAAVTRELVAQFEESEGSVRQGLEATWGAVDRTVEGRQFADAQPDMRKSGLRRAIGARPDETELVVRALDTVVGAFASLRDPMAGRYFGMHPLPRFISS